jgi:two-component system OmpR family response regulator
MKILIIEDNADIAKQISKYIAEYGFVAHIEHDGEGGLFEAENNIYDAIILDLGLPEIDGMQILERIRAMGKTLPIIILTARNSKAEVIKGLENGADDYITKPFDMEEVLARLRSALRRFKGQSTQLAKYNDVVFDMQKGKVNVAGEAVKLTRIEFIILQYLFINQGKTVSASELSEHAYEDFDNDSAIIPRHIANIRKKIGHEAIKTDSNRGYYVPLEG